MKRHLKCYNSCNFCSGKTHIFHLPSLARTYIHAYPFAPPPHIDRIGIAAAAAAAAADEATNAAWAMLEHVLVRQRERERKRLLQGE